MQAEDLRRLLDAQPLLRLLVGAARVAAELLVTRERLSLRKALETRGDARVGVDVDGQVQEALVATGHALAEHAARLVGEHALKELVNEGLRRGRLVGIGATAGRRRLRARRAPAPAPLAGGLLLLLEQLGEFVEQVVDELVSVLVHVPAEELVVPLEPVHELPGRNDARALLRGGDLCHEVRQAREQALRGSLRARQLLHGLVVAQEPLAERPAEHERLEDRVAVARVAEVLQAEVALVAFP